MKQLRDVVQGDSRRGPFVVGETGYVYTEPLDDPYSAAPTLTLNGCVDGVATVALREWLRGKYASVETARAIAEWVEAYAKENIG